MASKMPDKKTIVAVVLAGLAGAFGAAKVSCVQQALSPSQEAPAQPTTADAPSQP